MTKTIKDNGVERTGLLIKKSGCSAAPNIYLEGYYNKHIYEGEPLAGVLKSIAAARVKHDIEKFDTKALTDWSEARGRVVAKLINKELNEDLLENLVYTQVADLAVIYAIECSDLLPARDDGIATAKVTKDLFKGYQIAKEELEQAARDNMDKNGYLFENLCEFLFGEDSDAMDIPADVAPPMYILTTKEKMCGAVVMANKDLLQKVSKQLGGDFIILPSSVHEVLCMPLCDKEKNNVAALENLVYTVNLTQVAPNEWLSDHVYRYDSATEEIVIAA